MFKPSKNILITLLIVIVISIIGFNLNSIVEGLTLKKTSNKLQYTSCTQPQNCSDCINADVNNSNSSCYWNSTINKCGSFLDTGYSRTCNNNVCVANTTKTNCIKNGCQWNDSTGKCDTKIAAEPNCDKYTLLQTPLYVKTNPN